MMRIRYKTPYNEAMTVGEILDLLCIALPTASGPMFHEILMSWSEYVFQRPEERIGQALFNAIYAHAPWLSSLMSANPLIDPFYDDRRIAQALVFVEQRLRIGS